MARARTLLGWLGEPRTFAFARGRPGAIADSLWFIGGQSGAWAFLRR